MRTWYCAGSGPRHCNPYAKVMSRSQSRLAPLGADDGPAS
ncbi:hypothetical protein BN2475_870002 [Paraburkholderia ribeironis]|uniref:Uncharacterized protein n=1 Tax=Paraburkholderia ribeironis TaxID=1247936 RepID=A0A1N7SKY6_9BURK|nr:hypothetical protein BN2475_870002 [Paraburkholderia ribeironis]